MPIPDLHLRTSLALSLVAALATLAVESLPAGDVRSFPQNYAPFVVLAEDITTEAPVYFRAMRFNEATEQWNVDLVVTNQSGREFAQTVFLTIDGFSNTTGPLQADGISTNLPVTSFFRLDANGVLSPGEATRPRTIALGFIEGAGAPRLQTRVFGVPSGFSHALGLARSLNHAGQPLAAVRVTERGPQGTRILFTDPDYGVVTLGQAPGEHVWTFERDGFLPVWRKDTLLRGAVRLVPSPRLVLRSTNSILSLEGTTNTIQDAAGNVRVEYTSSQPAASVALTVVDGQTLPAPLPQGWSPLRAFWIESTNAPLGAMAFMIPEGPIAPTEVAALVKWNDESLQWEVQARLTGNGTNGVGGVLANWGAFALVVADTGTLAPPTPVEGQPLLPSSPPVQPIPTFAASGTVSPASSPASRVAEHVTATASVLVTNSTSLLPSGLTLRTEVTEDYRLQDSSTRFMALYETFVTAYRRPADTAPRALNATFPMRPLLLFGGDELAEATVRVDVLTPGNFRGGVFDLTGGSLANEAVRIEGLAGDFLTPQAAMLRSLTSTNLPTLLTPGQSIAAAFDLTVAGVEPGRSLSLQVSNLPPNRFFILSRILSGTTFNGLEPVERLRSNTNGVLTSLEPAGGERLPGLRGAGQYLLVQVSGPHALIGGLTRNAQDQPTAGVPVRVSGQPWLTFSTSEGIYLLVAPTGAVQVAATDLANGDADFVDERVEDANIPLPIDLHIRPRGPRVTSVSPAPGSRNVNRVTPIVVTFSQPLNPGTLAGEGVRLLSTNGLAVPASLTLNSRGTIATLLPIDPLAPASRFTIQLSTNIAAPTGLRVEGPNSFTFTTEADALARTGAQLIIYEPTNGMAAVFGSPGSADPESPVILVNETTGATATILSRPDGSFTNFITADVDDLLSAVLVNQNGTRTTLPASRQVFRDGTIGLFQGGGILEAESDGGPVQVIVEPGTIPTKTKFKIEPIDFGRLTNAVGTLPADGAVLLSGFSMAVSGDDLTVSPDVAVPLNLSLLPPGVRPEDASFALTVPQELDDGTIAYQIIDKMQFENGQLVTKSPPFEGALLRSILRQMQSTKKLKLSNRILNALGLPGIQETITHQLLLPIMIASGASLRLAGTVRAAKFTEEGDVVPGTQRAVPGALVTVHRSGVSGRPGRIRPGETFATAGDDGKYAFLLPADLITGPVGANLVATHPAFFPQTAAGGGTINNLADSLNKPVLEIPLYFQVIDSQVEVGDDTVPPILSFTQNPRDPPPGTNAADGVTVTVSARDDRSVNTIDVVIADYTLLTPGITNPPPTPVPQDVADLILGPAVKQKSFRLQSRVRAQLVVKATATDAAGNLRDATFPVVFAGDRIFPPPDGNAPGPRLLSSLPLDGAAGIAPGRPVTLRFSTPLQTNMAPVANTWLTLSPGQLSSVLLSPDRKVATVHFTAPPGLAITFHIQPTLLGANNKPFDQDPGQTGDQSHSLTFTMAPSMESDLTEMQLGGGAVTKGGFAFALERQGALDGSVVVYDLTSGTPDRVGEVSVPGFPRDLALIPRYSFKLKQNDPCQTRDLLAVVGGKSGAETFQYLHVFDVSDSAQPRRVASAVITFAISAVTKVQWSPPYLAYLDSGADVTSVGLVNLQTFLIGMNATPGEIAAFPDDGQVGMDANRDGDFCDVGDTVPLPIRTTPEFFGKDFAITVETTQRIEDFDFDADAGVVGLALSAGFKRRPNGQPDASNPVAPAYRTAFSGLVRPDPNLATVPFGSGDTPKRVAVFPRVLLQETNGTASFRTLALVSLRKGSGNHTLATIDISNPEAPIRLAELDVTAFGIPQSLVRRDDGLLALATSTDVLLIDPTKLLLPTLPGGNPPALVGTIPGLGSGMRSFAASDTGVNVVSAGGQNKVLRGPPSLRIISFPTNAPLSAAAIAQLGAAAQEELLRNDLDETLLVKSRFFQGTSTNGSPQLQPPSPRTHYYVRVDALAGANRSELDLALEVLNGAGMPLAPGGSNSAPTRLATETTFQQLGVTNLSSSYPLRLKAHRLSNDPDDALYTVYLAGPITVSSTSLSSAQANQIQQQLARAVVRAGRALWIGIDPTMQDAHFSPAVVSLVANQRLLPRTADFADIEHQTLPVILIPGVAGSHLTKLGTFLDRELWPGFTDVGKLGLSLKPGEEQPIIVRDIVRVAPEPYEIPSRFSPIGCLAAPIYLPLTEHLTGQLGLKEYDYLKPSSGLLSFLPCLLGTSQTLLNSPEQSVTNRTLSGADYSQISLEPNLFVFPYDWRRSNAVAVTQLKEYVELVKRFHPDADRVDIVAHSMGGLVARRFILDNPGTVNRLITLGSPWLGAPKAINALETGDFLDFIQHVLVIKKSTLKTLAEFFPGAQELVPSPAYFSLAGSPFVDLAGDLPGSAPGVGGGALTFDQFKQVMDGVYHTNALVNPAAVSQTFHNYDKPGIGKQDDWSTDNTGVEYFHIVGIQSAPNTIGKVTTKLRLLPTADDPTNFFQIKRDFEIDYTLGDGTVPVFSSLRINGSQNLNAPNASIYRLISPGPEGDKLTDHNGMLANPKLLDLVGRILSGDVPAPDPPPTVTSNVSHVVRVVNAENNEVIASTLSNSGTTTAPFELGDILFGLGGKLFFSREEEIPGLQIEESSTNIVDAVIDGTFKFTLGYDGRPINLRVDRLVDGVVQKAFIWQGIYPGDFLVPPPVGPAPLIAAAAGQVPAPIDFGATLTVQDDISSQPTLILNAGSTQVTPAPDAVLSGEAARDQISPSLRFHYTNACKEVMFTMADNVTSNVTTVFVGDGPFNAERTARLQIFHTNVVRVTDLMGLAVSNQVHVTAQDANGNVAVPITMELAEVKVFLDLAETVPLEDWPEVPNVSFRSPKRYIRSSDEFHVKVRARAGQPPGTYRIEVRKEGTTNGFITALAEQPAGSGIYRNANSIELSMTDGSPLNIVEETVLSFNVLNAGNAILGCGEHMIDRAEFAGGGIGVFYSAVDRSNVLNGATNINGFFPAGDGDFSDNIGSFPDNLMARFILQAGDELPGSEQADVMHVSAHGSADGRLFDDAKVRARGTLTINNGAIAAVTVSNPGKGYTNTPTVTITDTNSPPGSGAVITVTLVNERVDSFTIVNPGSGYSANTTIRVSSPGPSNLILDPAAQTAFAGNEALWNKDVEWVVLAACNVLNETNTPSGLLAWRQALDGSPRPAHGILGANFPVQRQLGTHSALFWARLNAGDTFIQAYTTGMENQGNIAQPWAYICYTDYLSDSVTNLGPDLQTSGTLAFDNLLDFAPADECDRATGEPAQSGGLKLRDGAGLLKTNVAPAPNATGRLPSRLQVRRIAPLASLNRPVSKRYQHLTTETVEFARTYQRERVSSLSGEQARASAERFLSTNLPGLARRLVFQSAPARISRNLPPTGPPVVWTNGYVVQFALAHQRVPVWGDHVRVTIAGDEIVGVTASAIEVMTERDVQTSVTLPPHHAFSLALTQIKQALKITGDYEAQEGGLHYVSSAEWQTLPSATQGATNYVLALRFTVRPSGEDDPTPLPGHVVWIDPHTGSLLGTAKK